MSRRMAVGRALVLVWLASWSEVSGAAAQTAQADPPVADSRVVSVDDHAQHETMAMNPGWQFMQDGVLFGTFNRESAVRRPTNQFRSQNWWMGMEQGPLGSGTLTATLMFSLEPATVGGKGYAELFQLGEAYHGLSNADRQHPHNFLMQAAVSWRAPLGDRAGFTLAAAPVGEAALGPVAFMHRASAAENPTAPLSHHTLDSTHIAEGVVSAALDYGPWMIEGSVFNAREPDDRRWVPMEPGPLDSYAWRLWFRSGEWNAQVSSGFLRTPEQLEKLDERRTTASVSWTRTRGTDFVAVSGMFGMNRRPFDTLRAFVGEATDHFGATSLYGRVERVDLETEHLLFPLVVHKPHPFELIDPLTAATIGAVRDLAVVKGFALGVGGDVTVYRVPTHLTSIYGNHPYALHVFFRLRPPGPAMGHMWNMTMTSPMSGHRM